MTRRRINFDDIDITTSITPSTPPENNDKNNRTPKWLIPIVIIIFICFAFYSYKSKYSVTLPNNKVNAYVTSDVSIRTYASKRSYKIATANSGTHVEVIEKKSGWYKVKFNLNNKVCEGWVYAKYLRFLDG